MLKVMLSDDGGSRSTGGASSKAHARAALLPPPVPPTYHLASLVMSINVSIPFTSPWLSFLPYSDGDAAGGWKAAGNGFGANSPLGDTQDAFRWTQAQGSKLNLNFNGKQAPRAACQYHFC